MRSRPGQLAGRKVTGLVSVAIRAGAQAQKADDYIVGDHSQTDNATIGQPLTSGAYPSLN